MQVGANVLGDVTDWWTEDELPDPSKENMIRPTGWRLVVRPIAPKTMTAGGLVIPQPSADMEAATQTIGRVLAIGPLCWKRPDMTDAALVNYNWASVGEYVMYGKYAGQKLTCDGVKLLILNDDEITAVVPNPDVIKKG